MTTLEHLSHDSYYNMHNYSQLTIDFIQEAEDIFAENDWGKDRQYKDEVGALAYKIDTILEVIDKSLEHDVKALETLYFILSNEVEGHRL